MDRIITEASNEAKANRRFSMPSILTTWNRPSREDVSATPKSATSRRHSRSTSSSAVINPFAISPLSSSAARSSPKSGGFKKLLNRKDSALFGCSGDLAMDDHVYHTRSKSNELSPNRPFTSSTNQHRLSGLSVSSSSQSVPSLTHSRDNSSSSSFSSTSHYSTLPSWSSPPTTPISSPASHGYASLPSAGDRRRKLDELAAVAALESYTKVKIARADDLIGNGRLSIVEEDWTASQKLSIASLSLSLNVDDDASSLGEEEEDHSFIQADRSLFADFSIDNSHDDEIYSATPFYSSYHDPLSLSAIQLGSSTTSSARSSNESTHTVILSPSHQDDSCLDLDELSAFFSTPVQVVKRRVLPTGLEEHLDSRGAVERAEAGHRSSRSLNLSLRSAATYSWI